MRVRIKICGITRLEDAAVAARAGADAIGLVFYPPSPRCLSPDQARGLRRALPPFVTAVALFVNPTREAVERVLTEVHPDVLQFHGEEDPAFCAQFGVPYIKACRVKEGTDLLEYFTPYADAQGWLADAYVEAYGGVGARFDWSLVPALRDRPLILSGGLSVANVGEALRVVKPWGVDVSSGVEVAKGIKDAAMIEAFIAEVKNADV
ncbi:MAG: phosphoribosylanthranilate isomerase [Betaproteobacteria bacterium]|nr:phosphoribosylanthranilate isomerase [Betaproteobacteria bacterium]